VKDEDSFRMLTREEAAGWFLIALFFAAITAGCDADSARVTAQIVAEVDARRALSPETLEDIAYWRRHEWNSQLCRGQTYVSQCCDHRLDDGTLTCLKPEDIR